MTSTESTVDTVRPGGAGLDVNAGPDGSAGEGGAAELVALMDLAETGPDHFAGTNANLALPRVFGGQVLAQGLVAAARTLATARPANSIHAYFLRAGDPGVPIDYRVTRVRDGRRLSCRSVSAEQHGRAIATMTISFADTSGGVPHQRRAPQAPPPDQVSTLLEASQAWGGLSPAWQSLGAILTRVDPRQVEPGTGDVADWTDQVWQRVAGELPDDPLLHQALLLYVSDVMQLASALVPHGIPLGREEVDGELRDGVSLDHAIWFHHPVRIDQWLLFEQVSPVGGAGRALTRADVFTERGELVASVAQEGLIFGLGD